MAKQKAHYVNDKEGRYTGTLNAGKPWQLLATLWRPPSLLSSAGHVNQRIREDKHSAAVLVGLLAAMRPQILSDTSKLMKMKRPSAQPVGARGFHLHKGHDARRCDGMDMTGR